VERGLCEDAPISTNTIFELFASVSCETDALIEIARLAGPVWTPRPITGIEKIAITQLISADIRIFVAHHFFVELETAIILLREKAQEYLLGGIDRDDGRLLNAVGGARTHFEPTIDEFELLESFLFGSCDLSEGLEDEEDREDDDRRVDDRDEESDITTHGQFTRQQKTLLPSSIPLTLFKQLRSVFLVGKQ